MSTAIPRFKTGNQLSARSILIWRIVQSLVWLVGMSIYFALIFYPRIGLLLFWNILIPIAPALLVVAVGIWRNVCPLATTTLLPRHLNLSLKRKMSVTTQARLQLVAVIALFCIVPLRHAVFNNNGLATAILLSIAAVVGLTMGFIFDWKSSWCSTLCPVHPVEKLYGGNTLFSLPNAHCDQCVNCSIPCPDSTPNITPSIAKKTVYHQVSSALTIGGLPGFIWGWFHVPDNAGPVSWQNFLSVYQEPFIGLLVSLALYLALKNFFKGKNERLLVSAFAASGVSCYYWYRIPSLLGFGRFGDDGLLVNINTLVPDWLVLLIICSTTIFFFWWLLFRKPNQQSWALRPPYAPRQQAVEARSFS